MIHKGGMPRVAVLILSICISAPPTITPSSYTEYILLCSTACSTSRLAWSMYLRSWMSRNPICSGLLQDPPLHRHSFSVLRSCIFYHPSLTIRSNVTITQKAKRYKLWEHRLAWHSFGVGSAEVADESNSKEDIQEQGARTERHGRSMSIKCRRLAGLRLFGTPAGGVGRSYRALPSVCGQL